MQPCWARITKTFLYAGKEMHDHLVEWVDKIFEAHVNKLFEIDEAE